MKTIQNFAQEALTYFETKTRDNGDKFVCAPDAPQWLKDIIYGAHGDMLPEDYKYRFIEESLNFIAYADDDSLDCPETEADCYTSDLTAWLHSDNRRVYYLTEALENYEPKDGFQALSFAQVAEKDEVYWIVLEGLRALADSQDETEEQGDE